MKKLITFLSLVIALANISYAQGTSIEFIGQVPNPIVIMDLSSPMDLESYAIKNATNSPITVMAKRVVNNVQAGQGNFFCWDNCYDSTVSESYTPLTIPAMATNASFTLHFKANNVPGMATVTMRFYIESNPSDYMEQTFVFNCLATAIDENLLNAALAAPAPNPATYETNLSYKLPNGISSAELKVMNTLGQEIRNVSVNGVEGTLNVGTSELSNGVYTLVLMSEGKAIARRRLVVSN